MTKRAHGFTVIELIFVVVILAVAGIFFFFQKHDIEVSAKDDTRKSSINAIYYSLEKVYYPKYGYYPETITKTTLTSIDPSILSDPNGVLINTAKSDYTYVSADCTNNQCKSYTLRSTLENEADYVKTSQHK